MSENKCDHCGASLKKYWHRITPGLVSALVKFYVAVCDKGENDIHLLREMTGEQKLLPHEWNNWTKLRFHGLVAKTDHAGSWLLTHRGAEFLKGQLSIPVEVQTYRNEVTGHSDQTVFIKDVVGKLPYFEAREDIRFDIATEADTPVITKVKKSRKKVKNPCRDCGLECSIDVITETGDNPNSLRIARKTKVCPNGHREDVKIEL
jgi:hypothetical protein